MDWTKIFTFLDPDSSYDRSRRRRDKQSEVERLAELERRKTAGERQKEAEGRTVEVAPAHIGLSAIHNAVLIKEYHFKVAIPVRAVVSVGGSSEEN